MIKGSIESSNRMNRVAQQSLQAGVPIPTTISCSVATSALLENGISGDYLVWPIYTPMGGTPGQDRTCYLIDLNTYLWDSYAITTTE